METTVVLPENETLCFAVTALYMCKYDLILHPRNAVENTIVFALAQIMSFLSMIVTLMYTATTYHKNETQIYMYITECHDGNNNIKTVPNSDMLDLTIMWARENFLIHF